jgi:hypothetical protein
MTAAEDITYPRKGYTVLKSPTSHDTPSLDHPLLLVTSTKTKLEDPFGAMTERMITIAIKAPMCIIP